MTKKKRIILIAAACVALAVVAIGGVLAYGFSHNSAGDLKIVLQREIPEAYIGEEYDVGEIIEQEERVEYSITAYYQNYYEMKEYDLKTDGLKFCPTEEFEINVEIIAKRGRETARKAIVVPVTYRADAIDELLITEGSCGWADPGITKTISTDETYLKEEGSHSAIQVNFRGADSHDFGTSLFSLAHFRLIPLFSDKTWENGVVTFWVYNPMPEAFEFQLRVQDAYTGMVEVDWTNDESAYRQIAKPGEWTQICFSLRKLGVTHPLTVTEDGSRNDALNVKIQYAGRADWQSMQNLYDYTLYVDGVDVVDASTFPDLDTEMETSNETIEQGWENMPLDTGWQGPATKYTYKIMQGENSTCSLEATFSSKESLEKPFVVLSPELAVHTEKISQLPVMNGGTLSGYFKFENMTPEVKVDLYRSVNDTWLNTNMQAMELKNLGNGWYLGTLDVTNLSFDGVDNSEIIRIRFNFTGVSSNSKVWMDTIKFESKDVKRVFESPEQDWINLALDSGQTNVGFNRVQDHLKAKGSVLSAKVTAPSDTEGRIWFSPESSKASGNIKKLPDMTKGVLHAWFYFGEQNPAASVRLYNEKWSGSKEVAFTFENKGQGWYYGTIPNTLFHGYNKGDSSKIIRIEVIIPQGYSVYMDGLMSYPNEKYSFKVNYADLFAHANISVHDAKYEVVKNITNKSKDAIHMWAKSGSGYPYVECSYAMPIDLSAYSNLTFDAKSENAYRWSGVRLVSQDAKGNLIESSDVGIDYESDGWNSLTVRLSSFENVNLKKVVGIRIFVNCEENVLKKGKTAHYYFDNLAVVVTDPPLTPTNPAAQKQDNDLIKGAFTASGTIKDVSGIQKVAADDTGKLSSNSALLVWANDKSGWPIAQFMFSNANNWSKKKAIYADTKFVNAHGWFSVKLIGYNEKNQLIYSNEVGIDARNNNWNTSVIDLSKFKGVDLTRVYGMSFTFNMQDGIKKGKLAQAYLDNVYVDADDDLFGTKAISYSGVKSSMLVQKKETNESKYAIQITTDEQDGWPHIYVPLPSDMDLSKMESLSLDTKMKNVHPWLAVELYNANGKKVAAVGKDLTAGDWQKCEIAMSEFSSDKTVLASVTEMRIVLNLNDNLGKEAVVLLDNLAFREKEEDSREDIEEASGDLLYYANFVWGPEFGDGANCTWDNRCEDVNGTSGYSWKFSANTNGSGWPAAQLHLGNRYDLSQVKLQFDVKFECEGDTPTQWISIKLQNSDWADIVADKGIDITGDGWQTVTISPSDWSLLSGKDLTNVELIKFNFNFDNKKGHNQAVYIDNLKLIP